MASGVQARRDTKDASPEEFEGPSDWSGPKLVALGFVTLLAALLFLYFVSPMGTPH